MNSPIFVLGAHKSGTSLLRSLFDNHPELFVVPFESHFFQMLGSPIAYPYRKQFFEVRTIDAVVNSMNNYLSFINRHNDPLSDSVMKDKIDTQKAYLSLEKFKAGNVGKAVVWADMFIAYCEAIHEGLDKGSLSSETRILEKSVENAELVSEIKYMFPSAKFIHIIRNPYANIVALRKFKSIGGYPYLKLIIETLENNYYYAIKNHFLYKDDYKIIKYEDLLSNSELMLKDICSFVEIEYNDRILSPTSLGSEWKGNSTSGSNFNGICDSNLNKWQGEISNFEVAFANKFLHKYINHWGYELLSNPGIIHKVLPCKGENLRTYLKNRIYLVH